MTVAGAFRVVATRCNTTDKGVYGARESAPAGKLGFYPADLESRMIRAYF